VRGTCGAAKDAFALLKDSVNIIDAATRYGVTVDRHGKALCFAHTESNSSLSFRGDRYKCFSCGAGGDVIDMVCTIRNISTLAAARELARLYGLPLFADRPLTEAELKQARDADAQRKRDTARLEAFAEWVDSAARIIAQYLRKMEEWKHDLAPKRPDDELHPLFVEAAKNLDYWNYLFEVFIVGGDFAEKAVFYKSFSGEVEHIAKRIDENRKNISA